VRSLVLKWLQRQEAQEEADRRRGHVPSLERTTKRRRSRRPDGPMLLPPGPDDLRRRKTRGTRLVVRKTPRKPLTGLNRLVYDAVAALRSGTTKEVAAAIQRMPEFARSRQPATRVVAWHGSQLVKRGVLARTASHAAG
jgi:hypothetical protein